MRLSTLSIFSYIKRKICFTLLIEAVFSYPGLGTLMQEAVSARDYPLIQYTFLLSSLLTIAALFVADVCYKKIDPTMEAADDQ